MFSAIGVKGGTTVGIGRGGKNLIKDNKKNRVNLNAGGYIGPAINTEYGGKILSNPSYKTYYKDKNGKSMI